MLYLSNAHLNTFYKCLHTEKTGREERKLPSGKSSKAKQVSVKLRNGLFCKPIGGGTYMFVVCVCITPQLSAMEGKGFQQHVGALMLQSQKFGENP